MKKIFWWLFLAWSALELTVSAARFQSAGIPALPSLIDFVFFTLAAAVILFEAASHVGWRKTWLAFFIVVTVSGAAFRLGAPRLGLACTPTMGLLIADSLPLALPLLWWSLIGGFYLTYHRVLPIFDARVVALLVALSALTVGWLLEPFASRLKHYWLWEQGSAPWLYWLGWLVLAFALARIIPLRGDSKPTGCQKPLTVTLILAVLFGAGGQML
ncbi:MAG: hypothetical protein LBD30_03030 [Verrucomicrobiales bacterium]|nr:hypothetical protein [Verrucomicrobiales bacterium]